MQGHTQQGAKELQRAPPK